MDRPLPDTTLWYVLDGKGAIHARIGEAPYRTALGIAGTMLPELVDELRLVLYAEVPKPARAQAERCPLWTPAWCKQRGITWAIAPLVGLVNHVAKQVRADMREEKRFQAGGGS